MTHPAATQNHWNAAARAAAAAAARLARGTRIRHGETPRKPLNIAEWTLGSSVAVPLFCFWVKEFEVFLALLLHPPSPTPWPTEIRRTRAWRRRRTPKAVTTRPFMIPSQIAIMPGECTGMFAWFYFVNNNLDLLSRNVVSLR